MKTSKLNLVIKNLCHHRGALCAPPHPVLAVGCSNMVSLCDAGSHDGCVGLLWAADAQRGQCSSEAAYRDVRRS